MIYKAAKGDRVRSFDFDDRDLEGERACYVEGVVVETYTFGDLVPDLGRRTDYDMVAIRIERQVFGGEEVTPRVAVVFPPQNGVETWVDTITNQIERI